MNTKRIRNISIILAAFFIIAYMIQDKLILHPRPWPANFALPANLENCSLEGMNITTDDGIKINAVYAKSNFKASNTARVVLYNHGNAGNLVGRLAKLDVICKTGLDVLLYDYRGFGASQGTAQAEKVIKDARACLDYLLKQKNFKTREIILYGESLGTGVAAKLLQVTNKQFATLVLESGFASLSAQAGRTLPLIGPLILKESFPTIDILKNYQGKLVLIHSKKDEIIPFSDSEKLFKACPSKSKVFYHYQDAGHNSAVWNLPVYFERWQKIAQNKAFQL
jgi:hypothetical protein